MTERETVEERNEEARRKAAEQSAKDARQAELDRREAMKKAQAKSTHPPLVTSV